MSSLLEFLDRFPDQPTCLAHLERVRWSEGRVCPKCRAVDQSLPLARRGYFHCQACRNQFTVLHGTPLEGTHLPLRTWFGALYLTSTSSKGISAMVLSRQLDIGYKTAWFLAHRIRNLMTQDQWEVLNLKGVVEADEVSLGGKKRKKNQTSKRDKVRRSAQGPGRHAQGDGRGGR
jgi:transposase-like protein